MAREYLEQWLGLGCRPTVNRLMTLGTPHEGTPLADGLENLSSCESLGQMTPPTDDDGVYLRDLNDHVNAFCQPTPGDTSSLQLVGGFTCDVRPDISPCALLPGGDGIVPATSAVAKPRPGSVIRAAKREVMSSSFHASVEFLSALLRMCSSKERAISMTVQKRS